MISVTNAPTRAVQAQPTATRTVMHTHTQFYIRKRQSEFEYRGERDANRSRTAASDENTTSTVDLYTNGFWKSRRRYVRCALGGTIQCALKIECNHLCKKANRDEVIVTTHAVADRTIVLVADRKRSSVFVGRDVRREVLRGDLEGVRSILSDRLGITTST
jgi:hypothetical protein